MKIIQSKLLAALLLLSSFSNAGLQFESMVVELDSNFSVYKIPVTNITDNKMFLEAKLSQITDPGQKTEKAKEISTTRLTANIFIVEPGASQSIQLVNNNYKSDNNGKALEEDIIYRLVVSPKFAKPTPKAIKRDEKSVGVVVNFEYELLLIQRASKPNHNLQYKFNKITNKLVIKNKGNSLATLQNIIGCKTIDDCKVITGEFLYADSQQTFETTPGYNKISLYYKDYKGKSHVSNFTMRSSKKFSKLQSKEVS